MARVGMEWHANRPDLLVANAPWERFLQALRETSGERFSVIGPVSGPWWEWMYSGKSGDEWPLLGGEWGGRSYVLAEAIGPASTYDRITALAAALGELVLGYSYEDTAGTEQLVAARGDELLRFTIRSNWGDHDEGAPQPGEEHGIGGVLEALGFDPDDWLSRGSALRVAWVPPEPERDAAAHQRLYFGPWRMRIDHIERAAMEEFEGGETEDDGTEAPEESEGG